MIKVFEKFDLNPTEIAEDSQFEVIGTNDSSWSWEYDSDSVHAEILLDKVEDSLYLKIRKVHTKSGLGAGSVARDLEFVKIGTLQKPDLKEVRTLLKKHGHERSRTGGPFSTHWSDEEGNKMSISDLLSMHKPEKIKPELKHIKPISKFKEEPKNKDIELVKYSDRSYALFGEDTKKIKDELNILGCKYNRFLTDPTTGQKRAGWICSIGKLDKVKELL